MMLTWLLGPYRRWRYGRLCERVRQTMFAPPAFRANPFEGCEFEESEDWETKVGWEEVVCRPVVRHPMAPRDALRILEAAGEYMRLGVSTEELITRLGRDPRRVPRLTNPAETLH